MSTIIGGYKDNIDPNNEGLKRVTTTQDSGRDKTLFDAIVILIDEDGNKINPTNPLPISNIYTPTINSKISVGSGTTVILTANADRKIARIINDSNEIIYLAEGASAIMNEGTRLNANGGTYEINSTALHKSAINGICTSGGKNVTILEGE